MARKRKYMYGKFHHDTYEFRRELASIFDQFLNKHPELPMDTHNEVVDLRNKVNALLLSWIGSKRLETKTGLKIPLHSSAASVEGFLERQARSAARVYKACEICGEKRITNWCHILPRAEGGPSDKANYIWLCPTHHHLFDHNRLKKEEWEKLEFSNKLPAARAYASKVRLRLLRQFWRTKKKGKRKEAKEE